MTSKSLALLLVALLSLIPTATAQTYTLNASAYNAHAAQTDSTPFVTATGSRARPGIVALSRDMLRVYPYGSRLKVVGSRGCGVNIVGQVLIVEDTMAARKRRSIDVFMRSYNRAIKFGRCSLTVRKVG